MRRKQRTSSALGGPVGLEASSHRQLPTIMNVQVRRSGESLHTVIYNGKTIGHALRLDDGTWASLVYLYDANKPMIVRRALGRQGAKSYIIRMWGIKGKRFQATAKPETVQVKAALVYCSHCGAKCSAKANFCWVCGHRFKKVPK